MYGAGKYNKCIILEKKKLYKHLKKKKKKEKNVNVFALTTMGLMHEKNLVNRMTHSDFKYHFSIL